MLRSLFGTAKPYRTSRHPSSLSRLARRLTCETLEERLCFSTGPSLWAPADSTLLGGGLPQSPPTVAEVGQLDLEVDPDNENISRLSLSQVEGTIAIDPTDPSRLFAASIKSLDGLFAAYSTDAGASWTTRIMADGSDGLPAACCDPKTAFDDFGNLFLTYLHESGRKIVVALSTDGGQTFSTLHVFAYGGGVDQPSIAVGPGRRSGTGSVWVTYQTPTHEIAAAGAKVTGAGAVGSFSAPQIAPDSMAGNFGDIAVGPSGEVLATYQIRGNDVRTPKVFASLDTDGLGNKGFRDRVLVTRTNVTKWYPIPPQATRTVDAEANLAWDYSGGQYDGRVYLVYTDAPSPGSSDTNIFVRFSDDRGKTWSAPAEVNDDTTGTNSQFLPSIALDQTTGNVAVVWYDARNDPANVRAQFFAAASGDGGESFSSNVQLSVGTSDATDPDLPPFGQVMQYGDYTGLAFFGGVFYPVWADNSTELAGNPDPPQFDLATVRVVVRTSAMQIPL